MTNLADARQVQKADRKEKDLRQQQLNDIRTVLNNASGRRFVWRLLEQCSTFGSVFSQDTNLMNYRSGKQDLGHFLMSEVIEADQNLLIKMMKDNARKETEL